MTKTIQLGSTAALLATLALSPVAHAQGASDKADAASQSLKAATVLHEIMDTPDKGIPTDLLGKAECVAVFPSVIKAGFVVGGRGGRGVASCRTPLGWSAPVFLTLGGASIGFQIGVQSTDFVMLFMNDNGMNSMLSDEFTLGADASVAAGPGGPPGRRLDRHQDEREDPVVLAQQGLVCRAGAEGCRDQAGRRRHARRLRRRENRQDGADRGREHGAGAGAPVPGDARTPLDAHVVTLDPTTPRTS